LAKPAAARTEARIKLVFGNMMTLGVSTDFELKSTGESIIGRRAFILLNYAPDI
jgi:hypothetical protein